MKPTDTTDPATDSRQDIKHQTEQARRVLMRLQWLVIILLASGIVWLYFSFESVVERVDERLTKIDAVDTRLNDMDDRIFAIAPTDTKPKTPKTTTEQDGQVVKIELLLAQKLFDMGHYDEVLTTLRAIEYQLTELSGMSDPIKATLKQSIQADIAYVTTLKAQPDAWQAHIIKMRELQAFLHSQQTSKAPNAPLSHNDVLISDAAMLLSLAIGSANLRDRDMMTGYLQEVRTQLESYITLNGGKIQDARAYAQELHPPLESIGDALYWSYELLANTPKDKGLASVALLP